MTTPGTPDNDTIQIDSDTFYVARGSGGQLLHEAMSYGQDLEEEWDFRRPSLGMGETERQTPDGYYFTDNIDATGRGLRLGPKVNTIAMAAGDLPTLEGYVMFEEEDSAGVKYLYIMHATSATNVRLTKIRTSDDTRITNGTSQPKDFTNGAASNISPGRPEIFDGFMYMCINYQGSTHVNGIMELTTVATGTSNDTVTNIDTAVACTALIKVDSTTGVTQLIRNILINDVSTINSGATGDGVLDNANWGDSYDVGVEGLTQVLGGCSAGGIIYLGCTDGLYTFDKNGNSYPIIAFIGRTGYNTQNGGGTFAFGDLVFYQHTSGLWRTQGLTRARLAGPDAIQNYQSVPNITAPIRFRHYGGATLGEWLYFPYSDITNNNNSYILACKIGPHPLGHALIVHTLIKRTNEMFGLYIDRNKRLWWGENGQDRVAYIQLGADGSPNGTIRGAASTATYEWYGPDIDFGRPKVAKQLRSAFIEVESGDSTVSWQLKCHRDSGTVESVGSGITTVAQTYANWTVGTNDTCYRMRPRLTATGTGDHDAADPKVLRLSITARSADTMRLVLTDKNPRNRRNLFDTAKIIRKLKNASPVTFREPHTNETFTGYVKAVNNINYNDGSGVRAGLEVLYERWQIAA